MTHQWQLPFQVRVVRDPDRDDPISPCRGRRARLAIAGVAGLALATLPLAAAGANVPIGGGGGEGSSNGPVTVTIPIAITSLTVSTGSLTYGSCFHQDSTPATGLTLNGQCKTDLFTVTNTGDTADILVQGADATPTGGGTNWTLSKNTPLGLDQYTERTYNGGVGGPDLTNVAFCDFVYAANSCQAPIGSSATEFLAVFGPPSSTTPAASFSTTVTWTAGPPS
jgi:hypothetical protein